MKKWINSVLITCFTLCISLACSGTKDAKDYVSLIEDSRWTKDSFYRTHENSPLRDDSTFNHLNYFPVSEDWYIECDFKLRTDTQIVIIDTKGYPREYLVYGTLTGNTPTGSIQLFAFKMGAEQSLFVPFVDATCKNNKSYGGGRFIECLFPDENKKVMLDFNQAYNPYCHYIRNYNCPVVPKQNYLQNEILAGESVYKEQKEDFFDRPHSKE